VALPSFISVINSASRIGCITSKIDNRQVLHMGQGMITFPGGLSLSFVSFMLSVFFFYLFHSVYSISFDGMVVCNRCIYFFFFLYSLDIWKFEFHYRLHVLVNISGQSTRKNLHYIFQVKIGNIYLFFKYIYNAFILFFILSYNILVTIKWHL
jgi:hypothetical protein